MLAESWPNADVFERLSPQKYTGLFMSMDLFGVLASPKPERNRERNKAKWFSGLANPQKSTMSCYWRLNSVGTSTGRLAPFSENSFGVKPGNCARF